MHATHTACGPRAVHGMYERSALGGMCTVWEAVRWVWPGAPLVKIDEAEPKLGASALASAAHCASPPRPLTLHAALAEFVLRSIAAAGRRRGAAVRPLLLECSLLGLECLLLGQRVVHLLGVPAILGRRMTSTCVLGLQYAAILGMGGVLALQEHLGGVG